MSDLLGTTLQDLLGTLKARKVRVPSEIGAFVALEVCESLARGPARVSTSDVRIADDGMVSLFVPPNSATADEAARAIVGLLASVLVAAGTGAPASLIRLVEDGAPAGPGCLDRLRDDLEAALVPLNRQAARRVLSRMVREARRDQPRPLSERPPSLSRLDEDLDALLDPQAAAPAPVERGSERIRPESQRIDPIDALLADTAAEAPVTLQDDSLEARRNAPTEAPVMPMRGRTPPTPHDIDELLRQAPTLTPRDTGGSRAPQVASTPASAPRAPAESRSAAAESRGAAPESRSAGSPGPAPEEAPETLFDDAPAPAPPRAVAAAPTASRAKTSELDRFEEMGLDEPPKRGGLLGYVGAFLLVALLAAGLLAYMRPDLVDRLMGRPPPPPEPAGPTPEEREAAARAERGRFGTITVTSTPPGAQVFLFVGRAPATIEDLSPGMAYEMMALVDGRAPSRVLLPADAIWEETPEGFRYEMAIQVPDVAMPEAELVLGATTLPRDALGADRGQLGSARVITTPPGAEVYTLIGFTPDVRMENIGTEEVAELLVWVEGYEVEHTVVAPSDWVVQEDGSKLAELNVTLREAPRRRR